MVQVFLSRGLPKPVERLARAGRVVGCVVTVWLGLAGAGVQAAPRFQLLSQGDEVLDVPHHLIWRRCSEGQTQSSGGCVGMPTVFTWTDAQHHATTLASLLEQAWRLPTSNELLQLVQIRRQDPRAARIHPRIFPNTPADWYWTATEDSTHTDLAGVVDFLSGQPGFDLKVGGLGGELRLVRNSD